MHLIKFINYNLINHKILNISNNNYEQINKCTKYEQINKYTKYNNNKQFNKINLNCYNLLNYLIKILGYVDFNDITVLNYIF